MTKKQIAPADFAELLQEDQLELLRRDGVFVGKLKKGGQFIILLLKLSLLYFQWLSIVRYPLKLKMKTHIFYYRP